MQLTRRTLLATACATPLLGLPHGGAGAAVRATAGLCTKSRFLPLVGSDFVLRDGDAAHLAVLAGVDDLPGVGADERRFALEFALAGTARPGQATFDFVHPGLPRFAALAAPSNAAGDRLVAVFNSPG
jgi:hypothetical protein